MNSAVLGGGCFWCLDALYKQVKGVDSVVAGYAGGVQKNPSYHNHGNHAEVVKIEFDPSVVTYEELLKIFFQIHDPTTLNAQGNDIGTQYRSIILTQDDDQAKTAQSVLNGFAQDLWDNPVVTEIKPLDVFYRAEDYHQDYFEKNPSQAYCQIVINPKLEKFRKTFKDYLK